MKTRQPNLLNKTFAAGDNQEKYRNLESKSNSLQKLLLNVRISRVQRQYDDYNYRSNVNPFMYACSTTYCISAIYECNI